MPLDAAIFHLRHPGICLVQILHSYQLFLQAEVQGHIALGENRQVVGGLLSNTRIIHPVNEVPHCWLLRFQLLHKFHGAIFISDLFHKHDAISEGHGGIEVDIR